MAACSPRRRSRSPNASVRDHLVNDLTFKNYLNSIGVFGRD